MRSGSSQGHGIGAPSFPHTGDLSFLLDELQRQGEAEPRRAALVGWQCPVAARTSVFDVNHYGVTEATGEPMTAGRRRTAT
ncbi:hypothetical protein [Streptomyces sp. 769]|uniref:hypothetical protein n=1 Tax=Streptomyces sp. 769 TaxID=1262452 RepID=UPI000ADEE25F|nr:hypothetical protein [Streptomyces sp. 769]